MPKSVGRILLLDADGGVYATAKYDTPDTLRDASLLTPTGEYHQVRQTPEGQHVYQLVAPLGSRQPDHDLSDYRYPNDPEGWDGPVPTAPRATLHDVEMALLDLGIHAAAVIAESRTHIPPSKVDAILKLVREAWAHGR